MNEAMINPAIVHWARERAGLECADLANKMKQKPEKLLEWESGKSRPTFKQAQKLASQLKVPFGYLFLSTPPEEKLPIPDLRTIGSTVDPELGQNFRDLLNDVLRKQEWLRDHQIENGQQPLSFIGSHSINDSPTKVAEDIAQTIGTTSSFRDKASNWEQYLSMLIEKVEQAGIAVMRSGIVGSNTRRTLPVEEFRGFAISDQYAPLVFINASDAPSARLFTLIHELAHLWVGTSGISNIPLNKIAKDERLEEKFCNAVAAEFLVPALSFVEDWEANRSLFDNCNSLRKAYKVSTMVIARRAFDLRLVPKDEFLALYQSELEKFKKKKSGGGAFNRNLTARNGRLFSSAVVGAAMEGRLLLRDATRLLNISKAGTLREFAKSINMG